MKIILYTPDPTLVALIGVTKCSWTLIFANNTKVSVTRWSNWSTFDAIIWSYNRIKSSPIFTTKKPHWFLFFKLTRKLGYLVRNFVAETFLKWSNLVTRMQVFRSLQTLIWRQINLCSSKKSKFCCFHIASRWREFHFGSKFCCCYWKQSKYCLSHFYGREFLLLPWRM